MKSMYCFAAGMQFFCNIYCLHFRRKSTVLPSIFLHCFSTKQILLHQNFLVINNNIYLLGANSTVQFSNAPYNKINYILEYLQIFIFKCLQKDLALAIFFSTLCSFECSHLHGKGKQGHPYCSMLLTFPAFNDEHSKQCTKIMLIWQILLLQQAKHWCYFMKTWGS